MTSTKPVAKIILCGDYGVGKSSLFRRYVFNTFVDSSDQRSTLGFDHFERPYHIEGRDINCQLWDTGGLERVASITANYFKHAEAAVLVFGHDSQESFNSLSQHMLEILSNAESAKIFVCGNKSDTSEQGLGPSDELINAFLREYQVSEHENLVQRIFKVSCKTADGVHEMFEEIARVLARTMRTEQSMDRIKLRDLDIATRAKASSQNCCNSSGKSSP